MNRLLKKTTLLLIPFLLFSSCSKNGTSNSESTSERHYYSEVSDKEISYLDVFTDKPDYYFLYYYSTYCLYCARIVNEVVGFALKTDKNIYFVNIEQDYGFLSHTPEETIGTSDPLKAFCLNTPQFSIVENGKIKETYIEPEEIKKVISSL